MSVRAALLARAPLALLAALSAVAPAAGAAAQALTLTGLDGQRVALTAQDIAAMPHETLNAQIEGHGHAYEGVCLSDLLARVGTPSGKALKGRELSDVVLVSARDGYVVALALAETDPMMRKEQIILADRADGLPIPPAQGPYRLVVEGDLRAARAERMVSAIEVRRLGPDKTP